MKRMNLLLVSVLLSPTILGVLEVEATDGNDPANEVQELTIEEIDDETNFDDETANDEEKEEAVNGQSEEETDENKENNNDEKDITHDAKIAPASLNQTADELYQKYNKSNNARVLWELAQEFVATYPSDSRADAVINEAAEKHVNYAVSRHNRGDYTYAIGNYNNVLNEARVNDAYKKIVGQYKDLAQNKKDVLTADALYKKYQASNNARVLWELAQDFINYFPNDSRAEAVINDAAQKHVNYALNRHNRGDYAYAIGNYNNVLNEARVSASYREAVRKYKQFAEDQEKIMTADEMHSEYKKSNNARILWELAKDFVEHYPEDSRAYNVINEAAEKHVNYAMSRHNQGDYAYAIGNYKNVLNEKLIDPSYKDSVSNYLNYAEKEEALPNPDSLYKKYKASNNARVLWELAKEFIATYPTDSRADAVINEAAEKHVNYAVSRHQQGDYAYALGNYENVLNEVRVDSDFQTTVKEMAVYARNEQQMPTADGLYRRYKESNNARVLWLLAQDFSDYYPNDPRVNAVINEAAHKHMKYALVLQRRGEKQEAAKYYERIIDEPIVSTSTRHLAKIFLNQVSTSRKRVVYIDSGHGGHDSGAAFYGSTEKQLNLNVANYLTQELEAKGYVVINSRLSDKFVGLTNRAMEANNLNADIFVSIHHNSMGGRGTARGIESFIYHRVASGFGQETNTNNFKLDNPRISESFKLANALQSNLIRDTGFNNRGVKGNNFNVLRNTYIPAVLLELGFMDNPTEAAIIKTSAYQQRAARSIANGIESYLSGLE